MSGDFLLESLAQLHRQLTGTILVDDAGERVHLLAVHQDVQLHQLALTVADEFVIQGSVAPGDGFEFVVKIVDHLGERHLKGDLHFPRCGIIELGIQAAAFCANFHHRTHVLLGGEDARLDVWFLGTFDLGRVRVVMGVVHSDRRPPHEGEAVLDTGHGHDNCLIVLPFEPFLNDLQVE